MGEQLSTALYTSSFQEHTLFVQKVFYFISEFISATVDFISTCKALSFSPPTFTFQTVFELEIRMKAVFLKGHFSRSFSLLLPHYSVV